MNLPSVIQCGASPRRPLLEYLPSLGRGTAIHLRIGHPYISPADVRPSNGFGSLAYNKDAAVVVPAVAAVGRTPSSGSCIMYSLTACGMLFLFGWPPCQRSDMTLMEVSQRALHLLYIRNIWLLYIVMFFVNLIWYLYLFWLNNIVWVWVFSTCQEFWLSNVYKCQTLCQIGWIITTASCS